MSNRSLAVLVHDHRRVVLVVDHREHADPVAEPLRRLDEPRPPERPAARRGAWSRTRSGPGSSSPRSRSHRPRRAGSPCSATRSGRSCARPAARRRGRRRAGRGAGRGSVPIAGASSPERCRICGVFSAPPATTTAPARTVCGSPPSAYSTPVARPPSISTRSTAAFARRSSSPRAQASAMYVFIVDLPAFVGQPCRHEPQCMQLPSVYECTGSSSWPSAWNPRSTCARTAPVARARAPEHAARPGRSTARDRRARTARRPRWSGRSSACHLATSRSWARSATFVLIVVVPPTQRPARNATTSPSGSGAEAERPEEVVVAFASQRVKSAAVQVRAGLEQEDVAAALRELARDDAAARAGADDDDVESVLHAIPRHDQSLRSRGASGELKSISAHAPGPPRRARRSRCSTPRSRARGRRRTPACTAARASASRSAPAARARRSTRARARAPAAACAARARRCRRPARRAPEPGTISSQSRSSASARVASRLDRSARHLRAAPRRGALPLAEQVRGVEHARGAPSALRPCRARGSGRPRSRRRSRPARARRARTARSGARRRPPRPRPRAPGSGA